MDQFPKGSGGRGSSSMSPTPSTSTSSLNIKRESYPRPPSPAPSFASTVPLPHTILSRANAQTVGQISLRPLSQLTEDDQMSTISSGTCLTPSSNVPISVPGCSKNEKPFLSPGQLAVAGGTDDRGGPIAGDTLDWRFSKNSVRDRLQYILENSDMYQDVVFEVQGSTSWERVDAHRLILRIASPVFDKLFDNPIASCSNGSANRESVIPIMNVEPSTFKLLLKFIYTDKLDMARLSGDEILNLLRAAKVYGVVQLYHNCVQTLKSGLSDEVALKLCGMEDDAYEDSLLIETALSHIASKAFEIFPSDGFLQLTRENIAKLADRDDLRIDEVSLFQAVLRWAEFKCMQDGIQITSTNLRSIMEDVITKIRFPLISAEEFSQLDLAHPNILTADENVKIYQYICLEPSKRDLLIPLMPFKTRPRFSKKDSALLIEDSGSDSHNENPEREPSLLSNAQTEWAEITTTEPESETTSYVSVDSASRKRRRYERSDSGSSNKRKKEKRRHKKLRKTNSVHMDDLFGDGDGVDRTAIVLEDKTIAFNRFIRDCSNCEYKSLIKKIELKNVKVEDIMNLDSKKVYFPNLKEFNLNIIVEESVKKVLPDLRIDDLLFFSTRKKTWLFEDLWKMNIDITVIINKVIVVRSSPEKMNHIVLNKFMGAPYMLKSLKDEPVKSIIYSFPNLPEMHFPPTLRRLALLGIMKSQDLNSFLKDFKHLKDLTLVVPVGPERTNILKFNKNFLSASKLRKLALGDFKLLVEPSVRFNNMENLHFWKTSWEPSFEEMFPQRFPNLKVLTLIGPMTGSQKLLENILKIRTLSLVVSWSFEWNLVPGSNAINVLKASGVCETDKSFKLEKIADKWEGTKIAFKESQELVYNNLQYDFLYEDYATFKLSS